uniref:Uncharacterized protein n=1 Tax=Brassica campestris TaxID=3711 RepID=A0A3P6DRA8_BRACM|nr:unnamed protein product [Brassica rapa]
MGIRPLWTNRKGPTRKSGVGRGGGLTLCSGRNSLSSYCSRDVGYISGLIPFHLVFVRLNVYTKDYVWEILKPSFPVVLLLSFFCFYCCWNYVVWFCNFSHRIIWSYSLSMGSGILSTRNISKE